LPGSRQPNTSVRLPSNPMNNQKYILLSFLAGAALLGLAVRGLLVPTLAAFEVSDPAVAGGILASDVVGIGVAAGAFIGLNRNPASRSFTDEAITELRKVTWPSREETVRSTIVVVVFSVVLAGALGFYDYVWAGLTRRFIFSEG